MVKLATRHVPLVPDFDLHLFGQGRHRHIHRWLGAHPDTVDAVAGVRFATWAPRAQRVSVVGDFNRWEPGRHPMHKRDVGVWETFVPGLAPGALYKYAVSRDGDTVMKADPYGRQFEFRPRSASVVAPPTTHAWQDADWMASRARRDWLHAPLAAYEVHAGSWQRGSNGAFLGYRELAQRLVPYVAELGFTHLELMPISEHPFDASWGYQTIGYFAPTSRHGTADDLRALIDECHRHGLGVILDWTPAHFPADEHGLARFDGEALYEHPDPKKGWHPDWQSAVFDYGRPEVRNFLVANALYWLEEFHFDGLRVDAVASMLYLDYSRKPGEWTPNPYGGHEYLEAIEFLRELNVAAHEAAPGALVIAEESTAWPQVTRPTYVGGLGFSMKWNMGWMHDTLDYFRQDPIHRKYHHDRLTFGQLYAYSENFVLPLSHDEVVHGKGSLIRKMPGDDWQRFANLRLLFSWQWTSPGKKLLFMGQEFAQEREWNHDTPLDWHLRDDPRHEGVRRLLLDLNRLYRDLPALHRHDFDAQGFEWVDCHDSSQSVLSFLRRAGEDVVVVVLNFTPVPRENYRIGVPVGGPWREVLNSDSSHYGGSNLGNAGAVDAARKPWMGRTYSMVLTLPPLGALVLRPVS